MQSICLTPKERSWSRNRYHFDFPVEWQEQWAIRLYSVSVVCPRPVEKVVFDVYGLSIGVNYESYKSMIGDTNLLALLHRPPVCRCCVDGTLYIDSGDDHIDFDDIQMEVLWTPADCIEEEDRVQCMYDIVGHEIPGLYHCPETNERLFVGFPKNDQELTVGLHVDFEDHSYVYRSPWCIEGVSRAFYLHWPEMYVFSITMYQFPMADPREPGTAQSTQG